LVEASVGMRRDDEEPVRTAREAHRAALRLRAQPLAWELELLARRCRLDLAGLPAPARMGPVGRFGLTARELQVLLLLTRGYRNREIATELAISVKTASVHVSHIMRKLGVERRADAAAIGHRMGIDHPRVAP
jgi:DNA-binding NarL/FixJ family response regulator